MRPIFHARTPFKAPAPPRSAVIHHDLVGAVPTGIAAQHDAPGAPLHEVLALIQAKVSTVTGLFVRDGQLIIVHEGAPDEAACTRARSLLTDAKALAELAARAAEAPAEPAAADLAATLLDDALPDEAWLRAFRRYQVALLRAEAPESSASAPTPRKKRPSKPRRDSAE